MAEVTRFARAEPDSGGLLEEFQQLHASFVSSMRDLEQTKRIAAQEAATRAQLAQVNQDLRAERDALYAVVQRGHQHAEAQAKAVQAHADCLGQLQKLQQDHATLKHKFEEFAADANSKLAVTQQNVEAKCKELANLQQQLDQDHTSHHNQIDELSTRHCEQMAKMQSNYESRVSSMEASMQAALNAKHAAEEQLAKERESWKEALSRLDGSSGRRGAEDALKNRLLNLRTELDAVKYERDTLLQQKQQQARPQPRPAYVPQGGPGGALPRVAGGPGQAGPGRGQYRHI